MDQIVSFTLTKNEWVAALLCNMACLCIAIILLMDGMGWLDYEDTQRRR